MENLDDYNFGGQDLGGLAERFELMVAEGGSRYYELDELDELLEHYLVLHNLDMAGKVVQLARSQYPTSTQLSIKEAELLSLTDLHTEALDLLHEVEILESFNPDFYLTKAGILSRCGQYQKAIDSLLRAKDCASEELDHIYLNLAIEYQNLERYDIAIEHLLKALELNCDSEDVIYELAYCFELSKSYPQAVSAFTRLIDRTPYNQHAWFNLGASHQANGDLEKALIAFDYALVIDENFHAAYFNKAGMLSRLERYPEAIEMYKKALSFDLIDSLIHFYIGDCYLRMESHKEALIHFEKALRKDNQLADAWLGASSALANLKRHAEALHYAKEAVRLDEHSADYRYYLAQLQYQHGLPEEAILSFEKTAELGYKGEDLWEEFAEVALGQENYELCSSIITRGLLACPENRVLITFKAVMHYINHEHELGFELLIEVIVQEPTLIEYFIQYYPKALETEEIQFLLQSINN